MTVNFIHIPKTGGISIQKICGRTIKYNPHYVDIYDPRISNQLVVIRNPIERFASAVRYITRSLHTIHKHKPSTKFNEDRPKILPNPLGPAYLVPTFVGKNKARLFNLLFERGINTPDRWANVLSNPKHQFHEALTHIISNNESHNLKIGPQSCEYIYPIEPQSSWHHDPKIVIVMDNFQEELSFLLKALGINADIPHMNKTTQTNDESISEENLEWLKEKYAKDFELYYNYSDVLPRERIMVP